ncbi:unnamed protein product [Urochloa decumbens]|uniref:Disease resistance R13L4/SHOC-2-like LRR domain-containing protein n=1 Tax=Urochloa decumbens TaxID=240449 RepID=A0ABC9EJK8_9POAL
MAEPGNATVPLPPRETEAMDDRSSLTAAPDGTAPATIEPPALQGSLAAVVEPGERTATPPDEPARRAAPQEEPDAAAAVGDPLQTPAEAGGEPLTADEAAEVAPLPPPPSQEIVPAPAAAPVESESQLVAAAAPSLQPPPPPQEASSVHKEEKDAAPEGEGKPEEKLAAAAPAPEGEEKAEEKLAAAGSAPEGEGKPEEKLAVAAPAPAMARDGRRRWRQLQAAVRLMFLPCKRAARGGQSTPPPEDDKRSEAKPPASGEEEKKPTPTPTPAVEGGSKPSAPDGKQPTSRPEEKATSPPPAEATAAETTEKAAAAPPPPPAQKQEGGAAPERASSAQEEEKDAARRRWRWLRAAVNLIFLRPKPKGTEDEGQAKPSAPESGNEETKPAPTPAPQGEEIRTGGVPDKAGVKEKDEDKESKGGGHDVSQAGAVAGGDAAVGPEGTPAGKTKRFQKAGRRVMRIMSWYKRHRSSSRVGRDPGAPTEERKGDGTKPSPAPADGDKSADAAAAADGTKPASGKEEEPKPKPPPHPKWAREEARLEQILEDAFTRLLAAEYHQLKPIRKRCLLTFSVFDLAAEVKKQAMVYWWVSEFNLRHRTDHDESPNSDDAAAPETTTRRRRSSCWQQARQSKAAAAPAAGAGNQSPAPPPPPPPRQGNKQPAEDGGGNINNPDAEGIFSEFSSHGFLEPMRNWCSRVIHGCKVNPLVHWMVKRRARDERFADLDVNGSPAKLQPDSGILCLTADNRPLLQRLRMEDESQQAGNKPKTPRTASSSVQSATKDDKEKAQDQKNIQMVLDHDEIAKLFKGKQVILNVNAHVYPVSKSTFLHLADCLVVLQLGRWCNLDDDTYMEVDGLESLSTIGSLKNLRYLSLRGLSRLTELPIGIRFLKKLAILDMRGCQNLVNVASKITAPLKQLTHLDLTECYMLEHIGRGIIFLSELRVFKGFVFATGTQGNKACRLQDLRRLKKLQKLTISVTTDANVGKGEMAELKYLASLRKLTITWSEIPSILDGDSEKVKKRRVDLIEKWTSFELPTELLKLDLRCYPKNELKLKVHKSLKKLYLRGGDLERFFIDESNFTNSSEKTNSINTLRLRYLKNFSMEWEEIRSSLKYIEYVEIVSKDEKPMDDAGKDEMGKDMDIKDQKDNNIDMKDQQNTNIDTKDLKDTEEGGKLVKNIETKDMKKESKLVQQKKILYSTLDENGVWVKDNKEEKYLNWIAQATKEKEEKSKGPTEDPSTKASSTITDVNKNESSNATKEQPGEEQVTNEVPPQLKT